MSESARLKMAVALIVLAVIAACTDGIDSVGQSEFDEDDCRFSGCPEPEMLPDAGADPEPLPEPDPQPDFQPDPEPDGRNMDPGTGETHWIVLDIASRALGTASSSDAETGLPFEDDRERQWARPALVGFYARWLAEVASGQLRSEVITEPEALSRLNLLVRSLGGIVDDPSVGYEGLLPQLAPRDGGWARRDSPEGQRAMIADNAQLSLALASSVGALLTIAETPGALEAIEGIEYILERQRNGFVQSVECTSDEPNQSCVFRTGIDIDSEQWLDSMPAIHDHFGSQERGPLMFVVAYYDLPVEAIASLVVHMRANPDGAALSHTLLSPDGGAWQMLGIASQLPVLSHSDANRALLDHYARLSIGHAVENGLTGLLSPTWRAPGQFVQEAGLSLLSTRRSPPRNEAVSALYALGAARATSESATDAFLDKLFDEGQADNLITRDGLLSGTDETGQAVQERVAIDALRLILDLADNGPGNIERFLNRHDRRRALLDLWRTSNLQGNLIPETLDAVSLSGADGYQVAINNSGQLVVEGPPLTEDAPLVEVRIAYQGLDLAGTELIVDLKSIESVPATMTLWRGKTELRGRVELHPAKPPTNGLMLSRNVLLPTTPALWDVQEIVFAFQGPTENPLSVTFNIFETGAD